MPQKTSPPPGVSETVWRRARVAGYSSTEADAIARERAEKEERKAAAIENGKKGDGDGDTDTVLMDGFEFGSDMDIDGVVFSREALNETMSQAQTAFGADSAFKNNPSLIQNAAKASTAVAAGIVAVKMGGNASGASPKDGDVALRPESQKLIAAFKERAHNPAHPNFVARLQKGYLNDRDLNDLVTRSHKNELTPEEKQREVIESKKALERAGILVVRSNEPAAAAGSRPQQNLNWAIGPRELPLPRGARPALEQSSAPETDYFQKGGNPKVFPSPLGSHFGAP